MLHGHFIFHDVYLVAFLAEDILIHSEAHSGKMWFCIVLFIRNYIILACHYSGEYYNFDSLVQWNFEVIWFSCYELNSVNSNISIMYFYRTCRTFNHGAFYLFKCQA